MLPSTCEMGVQAEEGALTRRVPEKMSSVVVSPGAHSSRPPVIEVRLLGRFVVSGGGRTIRSWPRPSARRLCQLVLVSPGRRVSRGSACESLFPSLPPEAAARSLYRVLSMARLALKELGPQATGLLCADASQIWADPAVALAVDLDAHEDALHAALKASPGPGRDAALVEVLSTGGVPLEDELEAEWAARARERVEYLRQEARLELARDRSRGVGRAHPDEVLEAWQACLGADPTDEEAAAALMQLYVAHGRRPAAVAVYERCRAALADLGLRTSPALEEVRANAEDRVPALTTMSAPVGPRLVGVRRGEERRLVTVVFVDLNPAGLGRQVDPEDLRELTSAGLAQTMSEVEAFGGTVVSISGFGMSVLFGAPQSHEDDPERALRAALRIAAAVGRPEARRERVSWQPGMPDARSTDGAFSTYWRGVRDSGSGADGRRGPEAIRGGRPGSRRRRRASRSGQTGHRARGPGYACSRRRDLRVGAGPGHTRTFG